MSFTYCDADTSKNVLSFEMVADCYQPVSLIWDCKGSAENAPLSSSSSKKVEIF